MKMGSWKELDKHFTWAAVVGKYFTAIVFPLEASYKVIFDSRPLVPGFDRSTISFERSPLQSAASTDKFRFYLGPMKKDILAPVQRPGADTARQLGAGCGPGCHHVDPHRVAGDPHEVRAGLFLPSHPELRHRDHPAHRSSPSSFSCR